MNNQKLAQKALKAGVDFVEIDVSKRLIFNKFTAQHNGLMGIVGWGRMLETILTAEVKTRAFLDLKPISYRATFAARFIELLLKLGIKNAKICGHNWEMISQLAQKNNAKPYYTIKDDDGLQKFKRAMSRLAKPAGLSVKHNLIDKKFMEFVGNLPAGRQVWAWTVNDLVEVKRLADLKVDGIITDKWEQLSTLNQKLQT